LGTDVKSFRASFKVAKESFNI